jgi:hypothetical protein
MPDFVISPLVKFALSAVGAATVVAWMVREVKRINEEFERERLVKITEPARRDSMPTLRRDPRTGDYRVM